MEGRFICLSRKSTRYGVSRESNMLVSSPKCGSVPYGCCDTVWNSAFVGPLNFRSRNWIHMTRERTTCNLFEGNRMVRGYLN